MMSRRESARPKQFLQRAARLCAALFLGACAVIPLHADDESFVIDSDAAMFRFLDTYCLDCHADAEPEAGLNLLPYESIDEISRNTEVWNTVLGRLTDGDMPPKDEPAPDDAQRVQFVDWVTEQLHLAACRNGVLPGAHPIRRLNRTEYAATIRDLLGTHFNAGNALPADGAGGEGFDNAAETLFTSPLHAEKYLEAARNALDYAMKDPRSRRQFIVAQPDENRSPEAAAREVLEQFLARAFRRPAEADEVSQYLELFNLAFAEDPSYLNSVQFALQGVLISPDFLFRHEAPNESEGPALVGHYEMASRLSYFLWGSMPDEELFKLAGEGKLNTPEVLDQQVERMLKDRKTRDFAESFVEQWLGTRNLGRDIRPDRELFRNYNSELESAMKYEPVLFFQDLLEQNHSILNLIDADYSYLNDQLARLYRINLEGTSGQHKRYDLPEDSRRGGVLAMSAVLAVSSFPERTSPVLRGKWILETILGTPPPPAPPNVPELEEVHEGETPTSLRERLEQHRANPTCASCHDRIDPLGFGLENFGVLGEWREEDGGLAIDSAGRLPDGTTFDGPDGLKEILLSRKDQFARHLTSKLLGYALGRGLTFEDSCTIDAIVDQLRLHDYRAQVLIKEIVRSVPFRYKVGTNPTLGLDANLNDS